MKNKFINALQTEDTFTENGMPTNSSSGEYIVDMFFHMGALRASPDNEILKLFVGAFGENSLLAIKAMFHNRNIRGGQGERKTFRTMFNYLCLNYPKIALLNLENVVKFGRWDDLFSGIDTPVEDDIFDFILYHLKNGDKLCAKWLPRENKAGNNVFKKLIKAWELHPKKYRQLVAGNTQVVENLMCKNQWTKINYSHVPSKASHLYRKAFGKHDPEGYGAYLEKLEKGDKSVKVNAGAIFPSDVIKPYFSWDSKSKDILIEQQWKALPNYLPENKRIMPVCDVSGSMSGDPILVCVSLGLYLSERNKGPYENCFITFSAQPRLQLLKGKSLKDRVTEIRTSKWQMNTNLEAVFKLILNQAVKFNLSPEELPTDILILSDMQFDSCVKDSDDTALKMIDRMYKNAGYERPNIIFWNLRSSTGIPAKFNEQGVALVSGYSPSVMKQVFSRDMTPLSNVLETLNDPMYDSVII